MKREEKSARKSEEAETKREIKFVRKITTIDTNADFLSFNDVDMNQFSIKNKNGLELLNSGDSVDDIENRISKKYDRDQYPWISDFTLKIKDAFIFLHNEILDFVKFIEASPEDLRKRKQVVSRVKQVVK
jgi:DNA polymerase sigma